MDSTDPGDNFCFGLSSAKPKAKIATVFLTQTIGVDPAKTRPIMS